MAINKRNTKTGLALLTSANGTARDGANLATDLVEPGTLIAECYSTITTSSVIATFKAQVSRDNGTTWYDVKLPNNAANVATAAGTGSAVETLVALTIPKGVVGYGLFRVVATLSGAATAAADKTRVVYVFVGQGGLG